MSHFVLRFQTSRKQLESDHGDPLTLLNAYREWLEAKHVSAGGRDKQSRQWCRRRGLEEQRFYEMTKLRKQFKDLLQVKLFYLFILITSGSGLFFIFILFHLVHLHPLLSNGSSSSIYDLNTLVILLLSFSLTSLHLFSPHLYNYLYPCFNF